MIIGPGILNGGTSWLGRLLIISGFLAGVKLDGLTLLPGRRSCEMGRSASGLGGFCGWWAESDFWRENLPGGPDL